MNNKLEEISALRPTTIRSGKAVYWASSSRKVIMGTIFENNLIRQYRKLAPKYDAKFPGYLAGVIAKVLEKVNLRPDDKILDIGCGTGELLFRIYRREPQIGELAGTDISEVMLDRAREKLKNIRAVHLWRSDINQLLCPKNYFNVITMTGVAHYLSEPDLRVVAKKAHEYLIPGGQFIIIDVANDFITMKLSYVFKKILDPATVFLYSIKYVANLLLSANFKITGKELFRAGGFGLFFIKAEKS